MTLPTSPLATAKQMKEAYEIFIENKRKTLISFTETKGRPYLWQNPQNVSGLCPMEREDKVWIDNGAIYMDKVESFLKRKDWFDHSPVIPYFMDEMTGVDIDTELDYLKAKVFYRKIKGEI